MALFVVYWSPLTCVTDDPVNYRRSDGTDQPGLEFLRVVPTVWDETKVLDGAVGEHIVMARRQGRSWFVGGMAGDKPYDMVLPLDFLAPGTYSAHIYADPQDTSANYEALAQSTKRVTARDSLRLHMRLAGGWRSGWSPLMGPPSPQTQECKTCAKTGRVSESAANDGMALSAHGPQTCSIVKLLTSDGRHAR
ncbi:hypothetical protein D1Y84_13615 [Acidipila sp. EB88]|nr:hypothetical protein D1Y84_13615 [Acidipila sp. EB88]